MKFTSEKKKAIMFYILEKIEQNDDTVSKSVAKAFSVNQNTIHNYINELVKDNVIKRIQRGRYELVKERYSYDLSRKNGDLDADTIAFEKCLYQHINNLAPNVQSIWPSHSSSL